MRSYEDIIAAKERYAPALGFQAQVDHEWLWPFQQHAVRWALRGGRRALFEDTGLGKSRQQLAWAHHVHEHTGERVLILAPLAVGPQTAHEAARVGLEGVTFAQSVEEARSARIVITNYDRIQRFEHEPWAGMVLDESSILKSFMGRTRAELTDYARSIPFRLACTATPSPNDVDELGNHAEWLGVCSRVEMLARFFVNDSSDTGTWVLKGHAVWPFWEWVASWAISARMPSDLGDYSDEGYVLPPLELRPHVVMGDLIEGREDGALFALGGLSATSIHDTKRKSVVARAQRTAEIINAEPDEPWLVWCETQYEADAVMKALGRGVEVSGSMSPETKAIRLLDFAEGRPGSILVTKPKIAGFGMNWQRCARMVFAGGSYSYEAFYQAVRRCWRFGQTRPVVAHVIMGFSEQAMWATVNTKADKHEDMRAQMIAASRREAKSSSILRGYHPNHTGRLPAWLTTTPKETTT